MSKQRKTQVNDQPSGEKSVFSLQVKTFKCKLQTCICYISADLCACSFIYLFIYLCFFWGKGGGAEGAGMLMYVFIKLSVPLSPLSLKTK